MSSYFPIVVQIDDGRLILCFAAEDLPMGEKFKVISTRTELKLKAYELTVEQYIALCIKVN